MHINETAAFGLAWLVKRRACFDVFLMDDGHKFDDNILELHSVSQLLSIGGVLLVHDTWLPSIQKTLGFIRSSLPYLHPLPLPQKKRVGTMQVFVKVVHDRACNGR